jgi:hypothetical protein
VTAVLRNLGLLITRVIFGSYLAVHGAQKLFGSFGGHGLDATGAGFESLGMKPGKVMAAVAGASELGGGVLTAAGIADPLGPLAIAGTRRPSAAPRPAASGGRPPRPVEGDGLGHEAVEVEAALEVEVDQHREVPRRQAVAVPAGLERPPRPKNSIIGRSMRMSGVGTPTWTSVPARSRA